MPNDFGIKISTPGNDVKTAALQQLVMDSQYDTFKLFSSGSGTISVPAGTGSVGGGTFVSGKAVVTINHNLGYIPMFVCFSNNTTFNPTRFNQYSATNSGAIGDTGSNYAIDTTNLYIYIYNASTSANPCEYHWFIFYNKLL